MVPAVLHLDACIAHRNHCHHEAVIAAYRARGHSILDYLMAEELSSENPLLMSVSAWSGNTEAVISRLVL